MMNFRTLENLKAPHLPCTVAFFSSPPGRTTATVWSLSNGFTCSSIWRGPRWISRRSCDTLMASPLSGVLAKQWERREFEKGRICPSPEGGCSHQRSHSCRPHVSPDHMCLIHIELPLVSAVQQNIAAAQKTTTESEYSQLSWCEHL